MLVDQVRRELKDQREQRQITEQRQAGESGMSDSGFNDFMAGKRSLGPRTWQALYRTHPELRWLLEEYQRRAALGSDGDGAPAARARDPPPAPSRTP